MEEAPSDEPSHPAAPSWIPALVVLVLLAPAALYLNSRYDPPQVVPADAPAAIFSAERAYERLEHLLGDEAPHPLGSPANDLVRARLLIKLEDLGLEPEANDNWYHRPTQSSTSLVRSRNIVAELPSANPDLPAILLACHYDSVGAGPGASDDGAAVAALLEVADILIKDTPLARPVILLFTDGEEMGLHGARAFLSFNQAALRVGFVLNFEARGSSGGSLMFETSRNNHWMIDQVSKGLSRPMSSSAYVSIYETMPNSSDLTAFMRKDLSGINFAFIGNPKHYHSPLDNLENLDQRSLQHHGDNALGMVRQLLTSDWTEAKAKDNAVYTDVAAFFIIAWPSKWGPWMTLVILAALLLTFSRVARSNNWSAFEIVRGICCWGLCFLVGPVLGWLGALALQKVDHTPTPWPDQIHLDLLVPTFCAAMGVFLTVSFLRPRPLLFFFLHGIALSFCALTLSVASPGFSYIFLLPAFAAAGMASPLVLLRKCGQAMLTIACLVVALVSTIIAVPFIRHLPAAVGLTYSPPAIAAFVALLILSLVPLMGAMPRVLLRRTALLCGLGAFVMGFFAVTTPPFTEDSPQHLPLTYLEQEDAQVGQLSMTSWEGPISPKLTQGLPQLEQPNIFYPVFGPAFETRKANLPAPEYELLDWNIKGNDHTAKIRLKPTPNLKRSAQEIVIALGTSQGLKSFKAVGYEIPIPVGGGDGLQWLRFHGIPKDGLDVELTWDQAPTLLFSLISITSGLPPHLDDLKTQRDELPGSTAHAGDQSIVIKRVLLTSPVY